MPAILMFTDSDYYTTGMRDRFEESTTEPGRIPAGGFRLGTFPRNLTPEREAEALQWFMNKRKDAPMEDTPKIVISQAWLEDLLQTAGVTRNRPTNINRPTRPYVLFGDSYVVTVVFPLEQLLPTLSQLVSLDERAVVLLGRATASLLTTSTQVVMVEFDLKGRS